MNPSVINFLNYSYSLLIKLKCFILFLGQLLVTWEM
jgi:hypothetical protein